MPTNPYAVGARRYQGSGNAPNTGAVVDKTGYNERDLRKQAQQQAFQTRLQASVQSRNNLPGRGY